MKPWKRATITGAAVVLAAAALAACGGSGSTPDAGPAAVAWTPTGAMHQAREGGGAALGNLMTTLLDGRVLVAGGFVARDGKLSFDAANYLADTEIYDPGRRTWTQSAPMHETRFGPALVTLSSGKVLAAGGFGGNGAGFRKSAELYDPASGSWTPTADMGTCRGSPATVTLGAPKTPPKAGVRDPKDQVLLIGGVGCMPDQPSLRTAEAYDAATGTWRPRAAMADVRWGHSATVLRDGRVLVAGGYTGGGNVTGDLLASAEIYDPARDTWTPTGAMVAARTFHSAALLPDGKVLVAGGRGCPTRGCEVASAELYDPATGTWAATEPMSVPRSQAASAVLPGRDGDGGAGGRFVVAGGTQSPTAEMYDPKTSTWSPIGDMSEPRSNSRLLVLPGGDALIAGGFSSGDGKYQDSATAELLQVGARAPKPA